MTQPKNDLNQVIVIIPARSGSKRVHKKNLQTVDGISILGISIQKVKKIESVHRIIVSTDSTEFAAEARRFGAEVPYIRPQDLSDDFSGTDDVIRDVLDFCSIPDTALVCCLYPTAILSTTKLIVSGMRKLKERPDDLIIAVKPYGHPIERAMDIDAHGRLNYKLPKYRNIRTQDLPVSFYDAGQFYWATAYSWRVLTNGNNVFMRPLILGKYSTFDVDDLDDLEFVRQLYRLRFNDE